MNSENNGVPLENPGSASEYVKDPHRVPRVWDRLQDTPVGVVVSDKDGDFFRRDRATGGLEYKVNRRTWVEWTGVYPNELSPFTEVLEAE